MSYERYRAIQPTLGLAIEAFTPGTFNPMKPQPMYNPAAAGPAYLSGLGAYYHAPKTRSIVGSSGFGSVGDSIEGLIDSGTQALVRAIVNEIIPFVREDIKKQLTPVYVIMGVTAVAAIAAAGFGYANYSKKA
jgi:hypothetical protein